MHELKDMLGKCETDGGLSKDEIDQAKARLEHFVEDYIEKFKVFTDSLSVMEEVDKDLVVDVEAHADGVDLKWQRFL